MEKLRFLWKSHINTKQKLRLYDTVIRSKLVYGLESARLSEVIRAKLRSFQMKGYRQILGLPSTYINREYSHEYLMTMANDIAKGEGQKKTFQFIDEYIDERALRLLGHILRAESEDPMRTCCLHSLSATPKIPLHRRVGHPRYHWIENTMKLVWENFEAWRNVRDGNYEKFSMFDEDHTDSIAFLAEARLF